MAVRQTKIVNFYESTLASLLASGSTSTTLTAAPTTNGTSTISASSGTSSTHYFLVIDPDQASNREVVLVTQSTGTTLTTITRDIEARHTSDPDHQIGTTVRMAVLAEHFVDANDTSAAANTLATAALPKAGGSMTGNIVMADNEVSGAEIKDYHETVSAATFSSNTITADVTNGNVFTVALTDNVTTWTINNLPASKISTVTFIITQDGTGSRLMNATQINSTTFKTSNAGGVTLTTAASAIDIVTVLFDGTNYYVFNQPNMS